MTDTPKDGERLSSAGGPTHPSPARGAVGLGALWFGLGGGAFAWALLTIVNYAIAAQVCYPRMQPLAFPTIGGGTLSLVLLVVALLAITVSVIAVATAAHSWRRTRHETGGHTHWALDTGEGRSRFMAVAGMMTSSVFLLAILVLTATIVTVAPCW